MSASGLRIKIHDSKEVRPGFDLGPVTINGITFWGIWWNDPQLYHLDSEPVIDWTSPARSLIDHGIVWISMEEISHAEFLGRNRYAVEGLGIWERPATSLLSSVNLTYQPIGDIKPLGSGQLDGASSPPYRISPMPSGDFHLPYPAPAAAAPTPAHEPVIDKGKVEA